MVDEAYSNKKVVSTGDLVIAITDVARNADIIGKAFTIPELFTGDVLGHEGVLTTFYSYGEVQPQRQAEIINKLNTPCNHDERDADALAEALFRKMNRLKEE